jgi:hypothetical protein
MTQPEYSDPFAFTKNDDKIKLSTEGWKVEEGD